MSDKINEAIQEIAVKHGVLLSKDDPILILQTMNERLLEESRKAQQEMLAQFKEEMENISSQWKDDANGKAEKVLNAAMAGSKDIIARILQDSTNEAVEIMKKTISNSMNEANNLVVKSRKINMATSLSCITLLTLTSLFAFYF